MSILDKHRTPITLERIADPDNLRLALERIRYSKNNKWISNDKKGIYQIIADPDNYFLALCDQIKNGYIPSKSLKIYLPKSFIHTRTMTVLNARDETVYQAIINLLAQNAFPDITELQKKNSFGNRIHPHVIHGSKVLKSRLLKTDFFLHRKFSVNWKEFNKIANKRIKDKRYKKKLETDITSFFDSIPHEQLFICLQKYGLDKDSSILLSKCLNKWNGTKLRNTPGIGIPTGPIASSFVANIYLRPIDLKMLIEPIDYIRYVDDFKLFTKSEKKLYEVAPNLGILLNSIGLSLKSSKTNVEDIDSTLTIAEVDEEDYDSSFVYYDEVGNPQFKNEKFDTFIDDRDYQKRTIEILLKDIKDCFDYKDGEYSIKDKNFFKRRHDAVLSSVLHNYKESIIMCNELYQFEPDEELIDIIFFLIETIIPRSNVYIPFLTIYSNNTHVRDRIFELLERRSSENMEWVRYLIYFSLKEFELNQNQCEYLLSLFDDEEVWASGMLYQLLINNCYKEEKNKQLAINKIWEEKSNNNPLAVLPKFENKKSDKTDIQEEEPTPFTYNEDIKPICEKLNEFEPDKLTDKEKEVFNSKSWAPGQSRYFTENYKNKIMGPLIEKLRPNNRISMHANEVPEITGEVVSPFWSAAAIRALPIWIKDDPLDAVLKRENLTVFIEDQDGNKNPNRQKLNISLRKLPV